MAQDCQRVCQKRQASAKVPDATPHAGPAFFRVPPPPGRRAATSPAKEGAMGVFQPDTASGQPTTHGQPAFQMVRRGYDPAQVDAHITELVAA
jgi:DivIVA domain-containing protein